MKHIILASRSKRIFAALVDLLILIISAATIFFTIVMPLTLDVTKYQQNGKDIADLYRGSSLYLTQENGSYTAKSTLTRQITKVSQFNDVDLIAWEVNFVDQNLSKDLYEFYTTKYNQYGENINLDEAVYFQQVLKVGSEESNILEINRDTFEIIMIDPNKEATTYSYFLDQYTAAAVIVDSYKAINDLKTENTNMMMSTISLFVPILVGLSFIFTFIIPLSNKNRRTIGKFIFKLDVIGCDTYQLKGNNLFLRFLVYTFVEVILGIASFGGLFLVTYTMFLFTKNRRSLHDFVAKSVVIDPLQSIYFLNKEEENYILKKGQTNAQGY